MMAALTEVPVFGVPVPSRYVVGVLTMLSALPALAAFAVVYGALALGGAGFAAWLAGHGRDDLAPEDAFARVVEADDRSRRPSCRERPSSSRPAGRRHASLHVPRWARRGQS